MNVSLELPPDVLEAIAQRTAELLTAEHTAPAGSPYLTAKEAAKYLCCTSAQRIYDLTSCGRLPVFKEGSRSLYRREDLDALLKPEVRR